MTSLWGGYIIRVMSIQSKIVGTGSYLPERVLTNQDLEKMVDTSDTWIRERTGISERRLSSPQERTSDMALIAARRALESAGLEAKDIDMIVFATVTADQPMPSAACTLQAKLGCGPIMAFDISAACTGFVYALSVADGMIRSGQVKTALVIGAEKLSSIVDYRQRETCILFGDGAGAVILRASEGGASGFQGFDLRANGQLGELLTLKAHRPDDPFAGVTHVELPYVYMRGREIFKSAVRAMTESCNTVLKKNGLTAGDVDWLIPHQANIRIIEAVGEAVGVPPEKAIVNIQRTGNISSATIPVAFDEAVRAGRIQRGQRVLMTAFGGGLTYGATLLTF
ncbi:MAG TPA: beta-ketoacyl-ACP synthase III [Bdellovibrionales bacterium]|nr:beta-ketoacyl-ACP synthase III [Bdellovibrionales bacterium]